MSAAGQAYSRDEIYQAIRNADAAGDSEAVQRLSQYLGTMDQAPGASASAAAPSAPQYQGFLRKPAMASQALAQGAAEFAGIPGDVEHLMNSGVNALRGGVSPEEQAAQSRFRLPTGNEIVNALHLAGPALEPQTPVERYGSAAIKAVPSIAATIASGGAAAPMIATGEAGALAGQGAHDLFPESSWAPVVAGLVSGLGVGGVTRSVENALKARSINAAVGTTKGSAEQAAAALATAREDARQGRFDLGTNVKNVRDASREDFAQTRGMIQAARDSIHKYVGLGVEDLAARHGGASTLQEAGEGLQDAARTWLTKTMPARMEGLWKPVNEAIPAETQISLPGFSNALKEINSSAGKLEPLAGLLKPSVPARLAKALESTNDLAELQNAEPGTYSWSEVQKLRTTLGDAMSNPKVVADVGQQNLSKLYATLTTDMRSTAARVTAQDPESMALQHFDSANAQSQKLYQTAEGPLSRLVAGPKASAEDPLPEAVAKRLLSSGKAGASDLAVLRQEMPEALSNLTAAQLRQNFPGWGKLAPEAKLALMPDQGHANTLEGLLRDQDASTRAAAQGVKIAQQQHQANMEAAAEAARRGNFAHAGQVKSSAEALAQARADYTKALEAQKALPANHPLDHSGSTITGILLGEQLGPIADRLLLHNSGLGPGAGAIVGALAPKVLRGGLNLLKPTSPEDYVYPALGAQVGGNALVPQRR